MTDAGRDGPPAMRSSRRAQGAPDDESALAALITPMSGGMKTRCTSGSLLVERGADL